VDGLRFDCVFYYVDGVLLELVPTDDPTLLSGRGNARLTLGVDDIEVAAEDLRHRGATVSCVRQVPNGRRASLTDPDANEIVLWQYA
jgi:predicted enzyme related to lactoylglutathione lyase